MKKMNTLYTKYIANKKGSLVDVILWMVVSFIVIIFFAAFIFLFTQVSSVLRTVPDNAVLNISSASAGTFHLINASMPILQWVAVVFILSLIISIFVSNFFIKANPVFFIIYILLIIVAVIFAAYLSNAYESILLSDNALSPTINQFTGANFIMLNLPYWSAVVGIFGAIILFINIIRSDNESGGIYV